MRYALDDLETARTLLGTSSPPRHVAFHAQQAAEKAIKAVLISEQIRFPYIHDLARLRDLVPVAWRVWKVEADLGRLSDYAADVRYPDDLPDVSAAEADDAVADASRVVEAVAADLGPLLDG
ncbi:HEPN domain-containing protein [Rubrivirga sp.]|uniref:HEPN domain-containing protein n=1 Tax=Rubrivirga sp. TaxID=1885344 RepID=UPI003B525460